MIKRCAQPLCFRRAVNGYPWCTKHLVMPADIDYATNTRASQFVEAFYSNYGPDAASPNSSDSSSYSSDSSPSSDTGSGGGDYGGGGSSGDY